MRNECQSTHALYRLINCRPQSAIQLPGRKVKNLTTDWNDGILVATLVDSVARGLCPECDEMVPANSFQNATQAMKLAEDWLGVLQVTIVHVHMGQARKTPCNPALCMEEDI